MCNESFKVLTIKSKFRLVNNRHVKRSIDRFFSPTFSGGSVFQSSKAATTKKAPSRWKVMVSHVHLSLSRGPQATRRAAATAWTPRAAAASPGSR